LVGGKIFILSFWDLKNQLFFPKKVYNSSKR
jgi:hypothetical protein